MLCVYTSRFKSYEYAKEARMKMKILTLFVCLGFLSACATGECEVCKRNKDRDRKIENCDCCRDCKFASDK